MRRSLVVLSLLLVAVIAWGQPYRAYSELPKADQQPFGFAGYVKDPESGLYYAKARYYDPRVARFTTEDPAAGNDMQPPSLHRYLYAYANPTAYIDPNRPLFISSGFKSGATKQIWFRLTARSRTKCRRRSGCLLRYFP